MTFKTMRLGGIMEGMNIIEKKTKSYSSGSLIAEEGTAGETEREQPERQ